jgi:hypothetical protein
VIGRKSEVDGIEGIAVLDANAPIAPIAWSALQGL